MDDVSRDVLFDVPLAWALETSHIEARRIRMGPSVAAGPHAHNGPVVGNVTAGSAIFQVEDGPEVLLRPGDAFFEPSGVRISRFDAQEEGVEFYAYFLLGDDQQSEMTRYE